jgi:hypothetical protein
MSYLTSHQAVLEAIGDKQIKILLQDILNNDYYLEDFAKDTMTNLVLETLEFYGIAFVSKKENRILLTQVGEKLLYNLTFKLP